MDNTEYIKNNFKIIYFLLIVQALIIVFLAIGYLKSIEEMKEDVQILYKNQHELKFSIIDSDNAIQKLQNINYLKGINNNEQ